MKIMKAKLIKEALRDVLAGPNPWDIVKDKLEWELEEYGIHEMEVDSEEPHTLYVSDYSDVTPLTDPATIAFGKSAYEGEGWFVVFEYPEPWPGAPGYEPFDDMYSAIKFLVSIIPDVKIYDPKTEQMLPADSWL